MAERFIHLYSMEKNQYSNNSSIIIMAGELLKDSESGKIIAQFKFKNISSKKISGLKISLLAYDASGKQVDGIDEYQYLDLNIKKGETFGGNKAILLPDLTTRSIKIKDIAIVFEDGSLDNVDLPMFVLPEKQRLLSELQQIELVKQYQSETNEKAEYVPNLQEDIWLCCCGEWNKSETCYECYLSKDVVISTYNREQLQAHLQQKLDEKKRRKEEEEKRREEIKAEALEKAQIGVRKLSKVLKVVIPVVIALCVLVYGIYPNVIEPMKLYKNAENLLVNGDYLKAIEEFEKLDTFGDAEEKVLEAKYRYAEYLIQEKNYVDAIKILNELENYNDCAEKILSTEYEYAEYLIHIKDYKDAIAIFEELGDYEDAKQRSLQTKYEYAEASYQKKDYEQAIELYKELNTYQESQKKLVDTKYVYAITLFDSEKYEEAKTIFEEIKTYKDSNEKINELETIIYEQEQWSIYERALSYAYLGHYEDAISCLNQLDNPIEDSEELKKEYESIKKFIGIWSVDYESPYYVVSTKTMNGKLYFYFSYARYEDGEFTYELSDDTSFEMQGNKLIYAGTFNHLQKEQFWIEGEQLVRHAPSATATNGYYAEAYTFKYDRIE